MAGSAGSQCLPPNVGSAGYRNVGGSVRTLEQCSPIYLDYASAVINNNLPYSYNFYWTSAIQGKVTGNYAYLWQAYSRCDLPTGPDNYAGANVTYTEWFGRRAAESGQLHGSRLAGGGGIVSFD
jgi:hypothetical protein